LRRWGAKAKAALWRALFRVVPPGLYLRLYARDTDRRVDRNPARASGHPEAAVAPRVMGYVRGLGVRPQDRLLDFGCGTLRTGKHLIRYLDEGHYIGVDISPRAVEYSLGVVERDPELSAKKPTLRVVGPFEELDLPWLPDYILCHSVFTHLPREAARRTFVQLRRVMKPESTLLMTAFSGHEYEHATHKDVRYPVSELVELAGTSGIELQLADGDWGLRQTVLVGHPLSD
jgi:SAM-dependent methyltransferase